MQGEVQLVRETLEGIVEPSVATSVLFESLSRWGRGVPKGAEQVLELVQGPLRELLTHRLGPEAEPALATLVAQLTALASDDLGDFEVDIEFDDDPVGEDAAMTAQMQAVSVPVVVLVVAGYREFANRLNAAIGRERVHTITIGDVEELRRTAFSANPQIVVVDSAQPAAIRPSDLARALKGLPDRVISFVWGEDTSYGRELRVRADQLDATVLYLARNEGIEPLLDLVLSRFRTSTIPPPAP
ncbi:MAG: hypothetical protein H6719_03275 [Sandaracinaceae bacterium]|nr:hypothetical protein [Sandaracinaceae bacterium]